MNPQSYGYLLLASFAGGLIGPLVMWSRGRSQTVGLNKWLRLAVLLVGTAATACALMSFARAFGSQSPVFGAIVMFLITGWAGLMNSVASLPIPRFALRVPARELAILRARWTGVRLFGELLRGTPLRHLGGRVFLAEAGSDPSAVLGGLRDAQAVHLWALLLCCPWMLFWAINGQWVSVACGLAVHAPLNIYPTLHLRYTTGRVRGYAERLRRGKSASRTGSGPVRSPESDGGEQGAGRKSR